MTGMDFLGSILIIIFIVLVLKLLNEWWEYDNNSNNTTDTSDLLVSVLYLWHDKRKVRWRNQRWLATQMIYDGLDFERDIRRSTLHSL